MAKTPIIYIFSFLILVSIARHPASAEKNRFSAEALGAIIVLDEGRKKPLDTYARNKLMQFSGKHRAHGSSALAWIARAMFDPLTADTEAIFLINNPEVVNALGIAPRSGRRYSFVELYKTQEPLNQQFNSARKTAAKDRTPFEKEIVRVHDNFFEYGSISSTFSFLQPNPDFEVTDSLLAVRLGFPLRKQLSYVDLLTRSEAFADEMLKVHKRPMDSLTTTEKALLRLANTMYQFVSIVGNPPPYCIPTTGDSAETWMSPWGFIAQRQTAALVDKTMGSLFQIRDMYLDRDEKGFVVAVGEFRDAVKETLSSPGALPSPSIELFYNKLGAFSRAKILLGLAALLALIAIFTTSAAVYWAGMALTSAAWILITSGIVLRMFILGHPPLSSLYETFMFVAWLTIIIGALLEFMRLRPIGLITASITGFLFLHIAGKYAGDGDTMGTLLAVLDSSFWLTTHIITISLGYAGCVAAGVIGHVYLISAMFKRADLLKLRAVERALYGILSFGLLFTVVGTIFGGMWADQAWGRFWGWDPKENGALLIILWCLTVFHARSAGMIKGKGTAIGAIIGMVLVMCAWIGVNLLGVGLHSYGFTSAGVTTLLTYVCVEAAFLVGIGIWSMSRKSNRP
jgi:ABC-type transport system involved in cytochrome c biogenesis permease subunit